jgi:SagB-type dehydrogenase family enzyme
VAAGRRLRRAPHVVMYWQRGRLVAHNYARGARALASPMLCSLLDYCDRWRTPGEIATAIDPAGRAPVDALLARLLEQGFLEQQGRPDPRTRAMSSLDPWNPAAGFFHTATKNVHFWSPIEAAARTDAAGRMPPAAKRYRGVPIVRLPAPRHGVFADVLTRRRTWRRFGTSPITIEEVATVLGLAAGVQQWVSTTAGDLPLKTSPSGGARHPIEAYVMARDVRGLDPGVYHYAAGRHAFERLGPAVPPRRLASYYPRSPYFAKAPVQVFLTAVFHRQVWRYPYARAYRAALAESGHVCQTLCLTATWLGLAPFCLMGLADSLIEADLGLDGISESVLYAAGFGRPPARVDWAPLAPGTRGRLAARPNPAMGS